MRQVVAGALNLLLFWAGLFGAAGTLRWPRGWAFLVLILGLGAASSIWLWRFDKGLFAERAVSPFARAQRPATGGSSWP